MTDIEFVQDWAELEEAVKTLAGYDFYDSVTQDVEYAVATIKDYVPRLLTQYASLLEMSFELTDLVKEQLDAAPKSGLYLPDHR